MPNSIDKWLADYKAPAQMQQLDENGAPMQSWLPETSTGQDKAKYDALYKGIADGSISVSPDQFDMMLHPADAAGSGWGYAGSRDAAAIDPVLMDQLSPEVQAYAHAHPQAFMQWVEGNKNPANGSRLSLGAEGGYSNLKGLAVNAAGNGLDDKNAGYMQIHDDNGFGGLGLVGGLALMAMLGPEIGLSGLGGAEAGMTAAEAAALGIPESLAVSADLSPVLGEVVSGGLSSLGSSVNSALDAFGPGGLGSAADAGTAAIANASGNAGALSAFAPNAAVLPAVESTGIVDAVTKAVENYAKNFNLSDTALNAAKNAAIRTALTGEPPDIESIVKSAALGTATGVANTGAASGLESLGASGSVAKALAPALTSVVTGRGNPVNSLVSAGINSGLSSLGVSPSISRYAAPVIRSALTGGNPVTTATNIAGNAGANLAWNTAKHGLTWPTKG